MDLVNLMNSLSVEDNVEDSNSSNLQVFDANINGVQTHIIYGEFTNKYLIVATQYEKIGSLLKVNIDQPENSINITDPVYSVSVVFGIEDLQQQAAARYIAEKLAITKPLMCFFSLKNYDIDTVKQLAEILCNIPQKE